MNRLIIVGNGFDLAHGLPTGYCDFIDWYWKILGERFSNLSQLDYSDGLLSIKLKFRENSRHEALKDFSDIHSCLGLESAINKYQAPYFENPNQDYNSCSISYKGILFRIISTKREIEKWVDVENEYYKLLKKCLKDEDNIRVKELNSEFEEIKKLLEKYLHENVVSKYNFNHSVEFENSIRIFNLRNRLGFKEDFLFEFADKEKDYLQKWISEYEKNWKTLAGDKNQKVKNLFLNFNYTPTVDVYCSIMNADYHNSYGHSEFIQIHGKLNDANNAINFGFGDEMDDDYKSIEKKDDNEYLRNIKSFQYLQTSNYKKVLSFMDSNDFQIYVMGHSCGLSDRILLNKIFEHRRCKSIKVFYYKNDEGDNYTDIVQNISRHFNKKEMMRERIVNKTLCEPLPQIKLPLKG